MTPEQLHILQHSLGLDQYGEGKSYRNHYVCDAGDPDIDALIALGFMVDTGNGRQLTGGMHCYVVTAAGKDAVYLESPKPPKKTRSQKRYGEYLNEDSGLSFGEWLREQKARRKEGYKVP